MSERGSLEELNEEAASRAHQLRRVERSALSWAKAIVGGIRDTAHAVVDEGRKSANETYEERWEEYEAKTKHRRRSHD